MTRKSVLADEGLDASRERISVRARRVGAVAIERPILRHKRWPFPREPLREPLLDPGPQVKSRIRNRTRTSVGHARERRIELLLTVCEIRQQRHEEDADAEAGFRCGSHCRETCGCRGGAGLHRLLEFVVVDRDRHGETDVDGCCRIDEQGQVATKQRAFGEDREGRAGVGKCRDDSWHQLVPAFGALIRIRVGAERHMVAFP